MILPPPRDNLSRLLDEVPSNNTWFWRCCWGGKGKFNNLVAKIAQNILETEDIYSVFVEGRYGTGKTSFIEQLLEALDSEPPQTDTGKANQETGIPETDAAQNESASTSGSNGIEIIPVKLHMPSLSSIHPHVEGLILSAIVDATINYARDKTNISIDLNEAMNHFWTLSSQNSLDHEQYGSQEPRHCRLATDLNVQQTLHSSKIVEIIKQLLSPPDSTCKRRLVVVLDDIDRSPTSEVVHGIMNVLLRFSLPKTPVTFILGASRPVLERGIDGWMAEHKLQDHGANIVTASSALEKYVQLTVSLPELGAATDASYPPPPIDAGILNFLNLGPAESYNTPKMTLLDAYFNELVSRLDLAELQKGMGLAPETPPTADQKSGLPAPHVERLPAVDPDKTQEDTPHNTIEPKIIHAKDNALEDAVKNSTIGQSTLAFTLVEILRKQHGTNNVMVAEPWRSVLSGLTLRQLKYFLRHAMFEDPKPYYFMALIREIYHSYWDLHCSESDLFWALCRAASRLHKPDPGSTCGQAPTAIDASASAMFFSELERHAQSSELMTRENLRTSFWPGDPKERGLLLALLDGVLREATATTTAVHRGITAGTSSSPSTGFPRQETTWQRAMSWDESTPRMQHGSGTDFEAFVQRHLGLSPRGMNLSAKVSDFQDNLSSQFRDSDRAAEIVEEYMQLFWAQHSPKFTDAVASTLSNLAVIIEDKPGDEALATTLFDRALELDPFNTQIHLYRGEFMLTALAERRFSPVETQRGWSGKNIIKQLTQEIKAIPVTNGDHRIYRAALLLMLEGLAIGDAPVRLESEALFRTGIDTMRNMAPDYIDAARASNLAPFLRTQSMLDRCFGAKDPTIRRKSQIGAVVWGVLDANGISSIPMRIPIANTYAGESATNSMQEIIGLRLNLGILQQASNSAYFARLGPIISQSASLLLRNGPSSVASRAKAAVAMLAADGINPTGRSQWFPRAERLRTKLATKGQMQLPVIETFQNWLDNEARELLQQFLNTPEDPRVWTSLTGFIFPKDMVPISTVDELAIEDNWNADDIALVRHAIKSASIKRSARKQGGI